MFQSGSAAQISRFCNLVAAYGLARAWVVSGRSGCQAGMAGSLIRLRSLAGGVMVLCDRKLTGRVLRWPGDHVVVACVLRAAQARSTNWQRRRRPGRRRR